MEQLPTPWPRCQELIELLGSQRKVPTKDDLILAVSHAWSHQLHPDPLGQKAQTVKELTYQAVKDYQIRGEALLFFDFMSMSQNPFQPGQRERTPQEQADFLKAINALPEIFFTADAVLHIDGDWPELEVEHLHEMLKEEDLSKFQLRENGTAVLAYNQFQADDGSLAQLPVYTVESVDGGRQVNSISDISPKRKFFSMPKFLRPNAIQAEVEDPVFVVRPSPLGKRNHVPADERGWIYFERLVSTIRVALTDEQYAARTCYSNIPELKASILNRATLLRRAASTSNAALKHQFETYISEIKTKTFAATSLDKKKASAATKVQDVDLVFQLLGEMRCRVSLALAFTVRSLSIEDCRDLVEAKADLTIQDGRGYTPLHNAVRFRNVETVKFLLESGARQSLRDKLGNTCLHVIPLYADSTTLQLCRVLGEDPAHLQKKNRAGLQVLQRLEAWALTAVNGGPYNPVLDWIKQQKTEYPFLSEQAKRKRKPDRSDRFQVSIYCTTVLVRTQERTVHVVEPEFTPLCHVVYLGLARFIPFSLQLPALRRWAGALGVKVWAICEDSVDPELMNGRDPEAFQSDLARVVEGLLPSLPRKFVLVDSSWGPGTSLLWKFKKHLLGAMIINAHLFKAPDFDDTEAAWKIKMRMRQLGDMFERRDLDNILGVLPDFMYPTGGADGVEATKKAYAEALSSASEKFWKLS
ncbi:unnamed protein product, partial [Symbiodinium sp. KB8]